MKKQRLFSSVEQIEAFLSKYIKSTAEQKKNSTWGRTVHFMNLLDNPQNKIKVIHIAGTSGKGSVTTMISDILRSQGFKIGTTISPHIYDFRERMQLNGELISMTKLSQLIESIMPAIIKMNKSNFGAPSYFEIMIGAAYKLFYDEKVDFAVIETGLGGLLDATNCANSPSKTAVITRIGYDHMEVLGNTISEIATQKVGIIHKNNSVFYLKNSDTVNKIIEKKSKDSGISAVQINPKKHIKNIKFEQNGISFEYSGHTIQKVKLFLPVQAQYQLENIVVALRVAEEELFKKSVKPNIDSIFQAVKNSYIPGRFERLNIEGKSVIFDGAHNRQKIQTFLKSLISIHPSQKFDFLVAFKRGKDFKSMLNLIKPHANTIFCTSFCKSGKGVTLESVNPMDMEEQLRKSNKTLVNIFSNSSPQKIFEMALKHAKDRILVVTGSLYLISDLLTIIKSNSKLK